LGCIERGQVSRNYLLELWPGLSLPASPGSRSPRERRSKSVETARPDRKEKRMTTAQIVQETPKTPISVSKMDIEALKDYTDQMAKFASGDGVVAIRICECCVLIQD